MPWRWQLIPYEAGVSPSWWLALACGLKMGASDWGGLGLCQLLSGRVACWVCEWHFYIYDSRIANRLTRGRHAPSLGRYVHGMLICNPSILGTSVLPDYPKRYKLPFAASRPVAASLPWTDGGGMVAPRRRDRACCPRF